MIKLKKHIFVVGLISIVSTISFNTVQARTVVDCDTIKSACGAYFSGDNEKLNDLQYETCVSRMNAMYDENCCTRSSCARG